MNAIFCMFTHLIYKNIIFYAKIGLNYNQSRTDQKGPKMKKKWQGYAKKIIYPNYETYEWNFWHIY